MPYRICKTFDIESGHLLTKHPHRCRFPHGHTRRIEIVLSAETLDDREMVCDFAVLKAAVAECLATFDHSLGVNTDDPNYALLHDAFGERIVPFEHCDPTSEVMARRIFDTCVLGLEACREAPLPDYGLRPDVRVESVRVWETEHSWAEYAP